MSIIVNFSEVSSEVFYEFIKDKILSQTDRFGHDMGPGHWIDSDGELQAYGLYRLTSNKYFINGSSNFDTINFVGNIIYNKTKLA